MQLNISSHNNYDLRYAIILASLDNCTLLFFPPARREITELVPEHTWVTYSPSISLFVMLRRGHFDPQIVGVLLLRPPTFAARGLIGASLTLHRIRVL